jgi:hypothetical protein
MRTGLAAAVVLALSGVSMAGAAGDLTVDVVTRATELNPRNGELAALTDGRIPETDPDAPAFGWGAGGFLVVEWPQPVLLVKIRFCLGQMDRCAYYGYLGGSFNSTGQRIGVNPPLYSREAVPRVTSGWFEVAIPEPGLIDNLGIQFTGATQLFEVEFVGPDGTAVRPASLGLVKRQYGR